MFGVCQRRAEVPKAALRLYSSHRKFVTDVLFENSATVECASSDQATTSGNSQSSSCEFRKRIKPAEGLSWNTIDKWKSRHDLWPPESILKKEASIISHPATNTIDGKAIAQEVKREIAEEVGRMRSAIGKVPGLAVVLVGSRKDSETYVRSKQRACEQVGFNSYNVSLPETVTEEEIVEAVLRFNCDPNVHGVLVQLPLPRHICEERVVGSVSIQKDVDGFHPMNVGRLAMQGRAPLFVSCTPKGCIELLLRSGVQIEGKHAVVIGRSNVVGMPAALLLQRQNATVTVVHSHTPNLPELTRNADIVIAAAGVPYMVQGSWLKPGAVVIDVGINHIEDPDSENGYRVVGDVYFAEACRVASQITPVPGGVGPMTIAMLLSNTLDSAKLAYGFFEN
ncbi:bifunctional protein FolD 2 [Physcomitrium patens]|uniref:Uncharacterized protein n=1 Tax=Physcomitrium patens TaxID=3218 RepID=A0A2K1JW41_PHYPA|nr:bifunctional protein FolD 2-like [Physcomitrium patens]PNR45741.1 hypothetical protein PHYPA_015512 [Physcomitrium patens]|eukprot:XP_024388070.1 bifunctional protein FolD 2-like [Physcomitrella patens]